jgi:formyl-CoA transferase
MKSLTQKECLEIFEKADVTVGAVADIEQLSSHPYIIERGSLVNLPDRDVKSGVLPAHAAIPRLSETPAKMRSEAPDIGENNEEIFREIGLSKSDLKTLEEQGVI